MFTWAYTCNSLIIYFNLVFLGTSYIKDFKCWCTYQSIVYILFQKTYNSRMLLIFCHEFIFVWLFMLHYPIFIVIFIFDLICTLIIFIKIEFLPWPTDSLILMLLFEKDDPLGIYSDSPIDKYILDRAFPPLWRKVPQVVCCNDLLL